MDDLTKCNISCKSEV